MLCKGESLSRNFHVRRELIVQSTRLVFASLIEFGFHSFPSTVNSSLGLVLSLLIILGVGWYGNPAGEQGKPIEKSKDE